MVHLGLISVCKLFFLLSIKTGEDLYNTEIVQPRRIKADLENLGFLCWHSEDPDKMKLESLILVMRNTSILMFCLTDDFVNDTNCQQIFYHNKYVLKKSYVLVTLGDTLNWQASDIGATITHELYIKINTIDRYKVRLPELVDQIKKKLYVTEKEKRTMNRAQCFISYCEYGFSSFVVLFVHTGLLVS